MLGSGGGHLASEEEALGVLLLVPVLLQPPAAHAPPLAIAKSGRGLSRSRAETQIELALIGRQVIEGVRESMLSANHAGGSGSLKFQPDRELYGRREAGEPGIESWTSCAAAASTRNLKQTGFGGGIHLGSAMRCRPPEGSLRRAGTRRRRGEHPVGDDELNLERLGLVANVHDGAVPQAAARERRQHCGAVRRTLRSLPPDQLRVGHL